jgi:hypothetical protein
MARVKNKQISRLHQLMKKLCLDINDSEICRRLEILMNTEKDDLSKDKVDLLVKQGVEFEPKILPEPYTQYVRHYLYMVKRKQKEIEEKSKKVRLSTSKKKKSSAISEKKKNPTNKKRPITKKGAAKKKTSKTIKKSSRAKSKK